MHGCFDDLRAVMLAGVSVMAGCGWILGLDEFTDQPPPGNAGGGGSGGECVSVADCPGGEHGKASCDGGACGFVCDDGFDDCDTELGCETATSEDKANCGGCGISCSVYCTAGSCNDPIDATVSNNHACAILMSGSAWCWGQNNQGELGDGTTIGRNQPVNVVFPAPVIQIEADGDRSCALLTDRTVWCWGFNGQGQLGIGTTAVSVPNPTPLPLIDIQEIALGLAHTCALDMSNRLFCWGSNDRQQVGNDSLTNALSPVQVAESVASVSLGARHTCAVKLDGRLACWGDNLQGQLGLGGSDTEVGIPVTLGSLTDVAEIACGGFHACARTAAGVRCWGSNQYGQLGMGSMTDFNTPQQLDLANVTALSMGPRESGALVADKVYVWGRNDYGQLGTCNAADELQPVENGLINIGKLVVGGQFSCALTKAHTLLCWGDNQFGQLGDGTTTDRCTPQPVVWP